MDKRWLCVKWTEEEWIDVHDLNIFRNPPSPRKVLGHPAVSSETGNWDRCLFTLKVKDSLVIVDYTSASRAKAWNEHPSREWDPGKMLVYFTDESLTKVQKIHWILPRKAEQPADPYKIVSLKEVNGGVHKPARQKRSMRTTQQLVRDPKFRSAVLGAYENRCCISGCPIKTAIDAAHIDVYDGPTSNSIQNGLPLRRDLHTLFDNQLLGIDPKTRRVHFAKMVLDEAYGPYQALQGKTFKAPTHELNRPDVQALKNRWRLFQQQRHLRAWPEEA